jgi:hypothetical protein
MTVVACCLLANGHSPLRGKQKMADRKTLERAEQDRREGKAPSTQAGEFVREEMEHIREGKHGARSTKQAIAIGLSKARRAGVKLPPPKKGTVSEKAGEQGHQRVSPTRSRAISRALGREGHTAATKSALAKQARSAASRRTAAERSTAAKKAVRTKGPVALSAAARKAARTRARSRRVG